MEFPSSYAYGGAKRKRKQGDSLRSVLESHVREHLNITSLKTQDRKFMAWTLGELAFFAYTYAVEQQESSGVPATQAMRNTDFYEVASLIAIDRGVLDQTPEPVLRRVSANMATRFWESRMAEALESFIVLNGPAQRNVCPRAPQPAPAQPQRRNPPAASRSQAAAGNPAQSYPAQHVPQAQNLTENPFYSRGMTYGPSNGIGTAAGPSQPAQLAQPGHRAPPPPPGEPAGGGRRPAVRSHGTQTWAPPAAPAARPHPCPEPKQESEQTQEARPLGPLPTTAKAAPSSAPTGRQAAAAAAPAGAYRSHAGAAAAASREHPGRALGERQPLSATAADVAQLGSGSRAMGGGGGAGRGGVGNPADSHRASRQPPPEGYGGEEDADVDDEDEEEGLPYTQRSGAASYDRQALRQQLLRPPPFGRSHNGYGQPAPAHHDNGVYGNQRPPPPPPQQRPPPPPPQQRPPPPSPQQWMPPPSPQQHQQQQLHAHRGLDQPYPVSPHGRSGADASHHGPDAWLLQQRCAACQTTPSSRDAAGAAVAAAARRSAWGEPHDRTQTAPPPQQQQYQRQERQEERQQQQRQQSHPDRHTGRQGVQECGHLPQQQQASQLHSGPLQRQLQQQQQLERQLPPPPSPQHQQPRRQQSHAAGPSVLASGRVLLAQQAATDAQPAPSRVNAGGGRGPGAATGAMGGPGPGRYGANGRNLALPQLPAGGGSGAGPSAVEAAAAAAGPSGRAAAAGPAASALTEPLWNELRREYEKRLGANALEKKLRKHLHKKGNSMIKKHCAKEGLSWTLLEVACYGAALQKVTPKPFDVESAVHFLARVKGWQPGGAAAAAPRGPHEPPPEALVDKVATVMAAAVDKYDMTEFIERQRRKKKQQQPAELPAAVGAVEAGAAGAATAAAAAAAHAPRRSAPPPPHMPYQHASPAETLSIGVTAPAAPTTTTSQQHSAGNSGGSGGGSSDDDDGAAAAAGAAMAGRGGAAKRVRAKPGATARKRPRAGSAAAAGGAGGGGAMEARLRTFLSRQGVSKLRRRNLSEGVGWTLLDLAEKDRDVRLQLGRDSLDAGEVLGRLLQSKLAPGQQLAPVAIQAVSMSLCAAHDKFQLDDFVAAEVKKRLKGRRSRGGAAGGSGGGGGAVGYEAAA